jgi:hypothetical protein
MRTSFQHGDVKEIPCWRGYSSHRWILFDGDEQATVFFERRFMVHYTHAPESIGKELSSSALQSVTESRLKHTME